MITALVFVIGAMIGSFLNVCIVRVPKEESIVFPSSHCTVCGKPVRWFDNIPIVSYFLLGGRCRDCRAVFSWRYALVEALTGGLFVLFYWKFGFSIMGGVYLALSLALLVESFIDLDHQIIPDGITLPGIVLGLVLSALFPILHGQGSWAKGLLEAFWGLLLGGGFLYAVGSIAEWILKKEAMGGGDVKLLAMIGTLIGWPGVLWTILVSSFIGSIVGIIITLRKGEQRIPFGPYLAMAAFLYLFIGAKTIGWYAAWSGLNLL